jgi:hypothetical protein
MGTGFARIRVSSRGGEMPEGREIFRLPKRPRLSVFEAFGVKITLNNANPTFGNASESREVLDGKALTG